MNVLLFAALTLFPSLVTASGSFAMVAKSEIYRKSSTLLKNFLVHSDLHSVAESLLSAKDPLNTFEIKKPSYDRGSFGKWTDADKDCLNTRHEILKELSTAVTNRDAAGCKIVSGRWLDPYTDRSFYNSRELHVDHLVPLAYAWARGAHSWDRKTRIHFYNDPTNLFAVHAATNLKKGSKGPTDWLPPNQAFQCQYVLRFKRVVLKYKLLLNSPESQRLEDIQAEVCR